MPLDPLPARRPSKVRGAPLSLQARTADNVHRDMWLLETTSPLWFVVLLAATSVAGTVAVLLVVEMARDRQ